MAERLVVVGGDAAGMSAATNARRMRDVADLEIVALERSSYVSYSACGEPYYVGGYIDDIDSLVARTPEEFARRGIDVHTRHEVTRIDTAERAVTVRDTDAGEDRRLAYDHLVYATGATTVRPQIDGIGLRGVYEMHTLDDALAVRRVVEAGAQRAVVVGGGYVGLEMAEAFCREGMEAMVVTAAESPLVPQLDADMGDLIIDAARDLDIEVRTSLRVDCINGANGRVESVGCDGETFPADVVLLALGTHPVVALAEAAGIPLGPTGAVAVDDRQRARVPGVWSAGDCCEARHRLTGRAANFHLGTIANKQGRIAGLNIGGADERFPGVLGTAITRLCEHEVARTGLTEAEARDAGIDALAVTFDSTTTTGYWPDARPMRMKVLAERGSRRLLGAQIVGGDGAGKRIDAFAMALWNEMTADEVVNVDLSYAPPFSGVWDPVLVGARKAAAALGP